MQVQSSPAEGYRQFLDSKRVAAAPAGFAVDESELLPALFDFQKAIVRWALHRGRAALFADCGLGKSPMQLAWAWKIHERTGRDGLIVAPLAVSQQTAREGAKFGIPVTVCKTAADVRPGLNVTNYERLHHFDPDAFGALVLDESSILKGFDGALRKRITEFGRAIPYRLACTATPAPNDLIELTNHAEFLDILSGKEIIALFFTQDGNTTHKFRLKGHARADFWRWLATWSVAIRRPSDLGFADDRFILPPLTIHQETVGVAAPTATLFPVEALTMAERRLARRDSLPDRVAAATELANGDDEPWLVWCDLNAESGALARAILGAVEIRGSDDPEDKERRLLDFVEGRARVLVTKPSIAGHGLNLQHVARMAFVGLSDSYEQFYQAVRRSWRFGQTRPVEVHVITAETEGAVVRNIRRKEDQAAEMMDQIVRHMAGLQLGRAERQEMDYRAGVETGDGWTAYLGDSVEMLANVADNTVGLTVTSPPFPGMYAYTNSARDMGNVRDIDQMIAQFRYLIPELLRVTMPGRTCAIHLTQMMAFIGKDGYAGMKDFRGRVIVAMEDAGWAYYGEVTIDKNPQMKAVRTKDRGLLFKTLASDSAHMHMAPADYLLQFRKPGTNPHPIPAGISRKYRNEHGWITEDEWIEWAAPVWYGSFRGLPGGIRETDVLNVAQARETDDERHLCPLQKGVIERAVKLWSNPGDLVLDPFGGIGSTAYVALLLGRRAVAVELKCSYFETLVQNCKRAVAESGQATLFTSMGMEAAS